ncbi:radical SAM protein [archaeon]|nr:MAG: radical SAM protein [archaeon]
MRKDIFKIIKYANSKGMNTSIVTNGTLVNGTVAKQLSKSGLNNIYFSIDGTKDVDDKIREKEGMFEKTIGNMKNLLEIKGRKLRVSVISVLMNQNLNDMSGLIALVKKMHADSFVMQPMHSQGSESAFSIKSDKSNLSIPKSKYKKIDRIIDKLMELKKENPNFIENSVIYLELARRFLKNEALRFECLAGFSFCGIDARGSVYPCLYQKPIGNVFNSSLKEIWKSDLYNKTRHRMKSCSKCLLLCHHRFLLSGI